MSSEPDPTPGPASDLTLAAVLAAVVCCGVILLVAAGVLGSAGIFLDNPILAALGVAALAWVGLRSIRVLRARRRTDDEHTTTRW